MSTQKLYDFIQHSTVATIEKYDPDQVQFVVDKTGIAKPLGRTLKRFTTPYETLEIPDNLVTTGGLGRLTSIMRGAGGVAFSAANTTCLGVGNVSTAATVADTQLGANSASNSRYIIADGAPTSTTTTVTNDTINIVATFTTSDGNFVWAEWGAVLVTTAASSDTFAGTGTSPLLFNHKIATMGTKAAGSSWVLTARISWA